MTWRKLGCVGPQHEIATVQTTAIDQDRLDPPHHHTCPRLGRMGVLGLAGLPGQRDGCTPSAWRRPDLCPPLCAVHLVGIAGEDDLDAPDLSPAVVPPASQNGSLRSNPCPGGLLHQPSPQQATSQPLQTSERRAHAGRAKPASLSPEASDKLRLQLLADHEALKEPDALATRAHRVLPLKNQLSTADAQSVETAFAAKLIQLGDPPPAGRVESPATNGRDGAWSEPGRTGDRVLTISKPVRERDRNHLRFVASQPCVVCGRGPSDAHHIKFAEQRAMGRKVSD